MCFALLLIDHRNASFIALKGIFSNQILHQTVDFTALFCGNHRLQFNDQRLAIKRITSEKILVKNCQFTELVND